jgi:hypothetical protein
MARIKKSRKATGFIDNSGPSRSEKLADPDSYDSRRRKAQAEKKKNTSVYEKQRQNEAGSAENQPVERKTRLADKIKKLNEDKSSDDA